MRQVAVGPVGVPTHPVRAAKSYTEYRPMTGAQKYAFWALAVLVFVVLFAAFGTEKIGYPKVGGGSMKPTIEQPFYVPFGAENVRHRGAYVHVNKHIPLRPVSLDGNIIMFKHDDDQDVKRVEKTRGDGAVWVAADNVGVTGADSRDYGWIAKSDVVGVVDKIITPQRLVRSLSSHGRFRNKIEFSYSPGRVSWAADFDQCAVLDATSFVVMTPDKTSRWVSGRPVAWQETKLQYDDGEGGKWLLDPNTMEAVRADAPRREAGKLRFHALLTKPATVGHPLGIKVLPNTGSPTSLPASRIIRIRASNESIVDFLTPSPWAISETITVPRGEFWIRIPQGARGVATDQEVLIEASAN